MMLELKCPIKSNSSDNLEKTKTEHRVLKDENGLLKRLRVWYNDIDYTPSISKVLTSLVLGAGISAPFFDKDNILHTLGAFAMGSYINYLALSFPNKRNNRY